MRKMLAPTHERMPTSDLVFVVQGPPVPFERAGYNRKARRHYTPSKSRRYRNAVAWQATEAIAKVRWPHSYSGKVSCELAIYFADARRRDADNVAKNIFDALNGIAWRDDSQVTTSTQTKLVDPENPRVEVRIKAVQT